MLSQRVDASVRHYITIPDIIIFAFGAICQQGTNLTLPRTSGRIILLSALLFCIFIFISYSTSILILLQSPSNAIRNIDDLMRSPLKLAIQNTGYSRFNYMHENDSILKKVYENKIKPAENDGWIYDPFYGVEKVRTQLFAFQSEVPAAYKAIANSYTDEEKCALTEIHLLKVPRLTATVARNSPYKELFRQRLT